MKKILILTVTAGNGHNACATAMKEKLESMGDVEIKLVDILKTHSTKFNNIMVDKGYSLAVGKFLPFYNLFFKHYQKSPPKNRYKCAAQGIALSTTNGLLKQIYTFKPDIIYCTHFYAAVAISDLRLAFNIPCKVFIPCLDYVNHPFWEACIGVDYVIIPNTDFTQEFVNEGFNLNQILPIGLPVNEKFFMQSDKKQTRHKLGLNPNIFTITIMFGGGHWSGGFKLFKWLLNCLKKQPIQIIMINGKNKKSFNKIAKIKLQKNIKLINVSFTDKVEKYLSASDVAINKLGGTSATETINICTPIISTEKLAAQEKSNLVYLKKKGVVVSFKNKKQLSTLIADFINNPEKLEKIKNKMKKLRTNSIDNLAKFITNQPNADYSKINIDEIDFKITKKITKKQLKMAHKIQKNMFS